MSGRGEVAPASLYGLDLELDPEVWKMFLLPKPPEGWCGTEAEWEAEWRTHTLVSLELDGDRHYLPSRVLIGCTTADHSPVITADMRVEARDVVGGTVTIVHLSNPEGHFVEYPENYLPQMQTAWRAGRGGHGPGQ